jgi:ABC-type nitrate/sulfonate/bicarbonate transport system substrate-binding protein
MRSSRLLTLLLAVLAALALTVTGCTAPSNTTGRTKIRFALDWTPNTNHTGLYVALQRGYFTAAGLDVEILPYNQALPDQLIDSGQAEFGISFQSNATVAKAGGAKIISVLAVLQHWASAIAVKANSGITRPAQLDGRTYAGFGEPAEKLELQRVIQHDGGTGNFTSVTLGTSAYEALYSGAADFTVPFVAWEGLEAERRGYDLRYFNYTDYGFPDVYSVVVDASPDWVAANPTAAKAFVQALQRGYSDAAADPTAAANDLINANPGTFTDTDLVIASQKMLAQKYLKDASGAVGRQELTRWSEFGKLLFEAGLLTGADGNKLSAEPDWSQYFTNDYLN